MPSYRLPTYIIDKLLEKSTVLLDRLIDYAVSRFPLTLDEVQEACMSAPYIEALRDMDLNDVSGLPRNATVGLWIDRDTLPGVLRSAAIVIETPHDTSVFAKRGALWQGLPLSATGGDYVPGHGETANYRANQHVLLPRGRLTADRQAPLVEWVNEVVRVKRGAMLARYTVRRVMAAVETSGELLALWPGLATLVEDPNWVTRLRNPPKYLHRCAPEAKFATETRPFIVAAEGMLVGASLLKPWEHDTATVRAHLQGFLPLQSDPEFTK